MTITEFLTARYDEEEAAAFRAEAFPPVLPENIAPDVGAVIIAPDRFLADIAAKRAIVVRVAEERAGWNPPESNSLGDEVLRLLVQPYAEHPDFDPAWRV